MTLVAQGHLTLDGQKFQVTAKREVRREVVVTFPCGCEFRHGYFIHVEKPSLLNGDYVPAQGGGFWQDLHMGGDFLQDCDDDATCSATDPDEASQIALKAALEFFRQLPSDVDHDSPYRDTEDFPPAPGRLSGA